MIKKLLGLLLVAAFGIVLFGCQEDTTTAATTTQSTATTTTTTEARELNLVISGLQQASERVFFTTFVKLFEARYDATVNVTYTTQADLQTKIETEQTSENVVSDVVMVDTANMTPYINGGWMEDITDVLASLDDRTITDMFDSSTKSDGKAYFVPISFDIYITIFNVDALPYIPDTVEVTKDESENIVSVDAITWEEFAEWAINIKTETGSAKSGFPMSTVGSQLMYPMGGLQLAFGSTTYPILNDAGAVAAWNLIADMAAAGAILPEAVLSETNQPTALLESEDLWLSFGHMGPIGTAYSAAPANYVLGPAPTAEDTGKAGSTAGAWTFGIVKGAQNQSVAEDWLEFITEPEVNYLYCSGLGGVISPVMEVVDQLGTSDTDKIMAAGLAVLESGAEVTGLPTYLYTSWGAVKEIYTDLYTDLLTGNELTQAQADAYQVQLEALLVD
ncbi:MAG: extracellular solute-binding protein [Bacilli bacterium]|nr:extracellular solute-binding protein [Bacilli bacterium]MBN2696389.1 extracellular solute-binding protein [Bacilli bacterium]